MAQKSQRVLNPAEVFGAIDAFSQNPTPAATKTLHEARRNVAMVALSQPPGGLEKLLASPFPDLLFALVESGIRDLARDDADARLLDDVVKRGAATLGNLQECARFLVVELLFVPGFRAHLAPDPTKLPAWLMPTYVPLALHRPQCFLDAGAADAYADHFERWIDVALAYGLRTRDRAFAKSISERVNYLQLFFNGKNLRPIYEARGKLLGQYFRFVQAHSLYAFLPRNKPIVRVGFLATHWTPQTETYFSLALIEQLDRQNIELILYGTAATNHPLEVYSISRADRFVVVGEHPVRMAETIRRDDLDILFIGTNMSVGTNLAAFAGGMRLARLQVVTACSPVTTGTLHADVYLSGEWNDALSDAQDHYTERLHRLPGSITAYAYHHDKEPCTKPRKRSDFGLSSEQIVFFSGANYFKVLPELSRQWVQILASVPGSALILMPFNPNWSRSYLVQPFLDRLMKELQDAGVDPKRLVIIRPVRTRADVHAILELADIYLDPFPFAGACSMLDPLRVGVAPVTRTNDLFRGSVGAAMLRMVGLDECVARTPEEYVQRAVDLANNREKRRAIRETLRKTHDAPPYMDSHTLSKHVGDAIAQWSALQQQRWAPVQSCNADQLRTMVQKLADSVISTSPEAAGLTDVGLVHGLIRPYFRQTPPEHPNPFFLDVGACFGELSVPFLQDGFRGVLFEPDPAARSMLEQQFAASGDRVVIEKLAVGDRDVAAVSFHKSQIRGLSGLGKSPYAGTEQVLSVGMTRLDSYCRKKRLSRVDFLKIDAEGHDFEALFSFDFNAISPRIVMVEYNAKFPNHTTAAVTESLAKMSGFGYRAVILRYRPCAGFGKESWDHDVVELVADRAFEVSSTDDFGNILFYRAEDRAFLCALLAVLDTCRPRRACLDPLPSAN